MEQVVEVLLVTLGALWLPGVTFDYFASKIAVKVAVKVGEKGGKKVGVNA